MKKAKFKMLLGFVATTTLFTTGSIVLSCGSNQNNNQDNLIRQKLDGITTQMVSEVITEKLDPATVKHVPSAPNNNQFTDLSINGVDGVSITISRWQQGLDGSINFHIKSINKGNVIIAGDKLGDIAIQGFQAKNFSKVSGVTSTNIKDVILTKSNKYLLATDGGLWMSSDGENFSLVTIGTRETMEIQSVIQTPDGKIFVATLSNGLWTSPDDKMIFTQDNALDGAGFITALYLSADNKKIWVGTQEHGLWCSSDSGATFTQVTYAIGSVWQISSIYQTPDGKKLFIGTIKDTASGISHGLWFSEDNGNTFIRISSEQGIKSGWEIGSVYQTSDGNIFVGTENNGLWMSSDNPSAAGLVFKPIISTGLVSNSTINSIYQTPDEKIFVSTNVGLLMSIDSGTTFSKITQGIGSDWVINTIYQAPNAGKIFVGTFGNGLLVSDY